MTNPKDRRRSGTTTVSNEALAPCLRGSMPLLALQFILVCALVVVLTLHQSRESADMFFRRNSSSINIHPRNYPCKDDTTESADSDPAEQQREFLEHEDSWTARAYNRDETSPALNGTALKLGAMTIADFCGASLGKSKSKSKSKFSVFRDAILAERTLFIPGLRINCSELHAHAHADPLLLQTRFNHGQGSTPRLRAMVVPDAETLADLRPHAVCHEHVYEPAVLMAFINWPQYGHAVFNGMSLLWEAAFRGPLRGAGPNVRIYGYADALDPGRRATEQETWPMMELEALEPLRGMVSAQPVRSLANLLLHSERHPVCFSWLLAGISGGDLDHYNFRAPLSAWRDFAQAVRAHFRVPEPPREDAELERVAPADALSKGEDPAKDLGPIRRVRWEAVGPDRPRLTILNRRGGRAILNVAELERVAGQSKLFGSVGVLYAEGLDMRAQVRAFGETDVLVGLDGTGLMNGVWMPQGGVVVHVRPFGCHPFLAGKGVNFDRLFTASPGRVLRHESGDRNTTRFPQNIPEKAGVAFNLSTPQPYRFSFILKQDTIIDPTAFRCILDAAHRLLHGSPVDWKSHYACTRSVFT